MSPRRYDLASGILVALLAIVVYLPGLPGDFVYDDHRLIVDNDGLKRPFDIRRSVLRDYYASDVDRMGLGYYRPVTLLTTEIDYRRGLGRPASFHTTNIAIHVACTWLLLTVGILLFGRGLAAIAAAALFAVHPAHAESVAFISGRVDPLATLFGLAALACHLRANRVPTSWPWRVAAAGSWLAALLSKEIAVTIPLLAAIIDGAVEGWPRERGWVDRVRRYAAYAAVVPIYLAMRWAALGALLPVSAPAAISWARPPVVLGSYFVWLVLPPWGLHLEPAVPSGVWAAAAAVVALAGLVSIAALWRAGWKIESALVAWCVAALLPVAQLRPLETELSERFLYLASAGAMLLGGALLGRLANRRGSVLAASVAVAVGLAYIAVLVPRARLWRDEVALWSAAERESGPSLKARLNLARAYAARGDRDRALGAFDAAAALSPELASTIRAESEALRAEVGSDAYEKTVMDALEVHPEDGALWNNLGFQRYAKGDTSGATAAFTKAIALTPNRGSAWLGLALCRVRGADWTGADAAAARAAEIDPALGLARSIRVKCALESGRACDAVALAKGIVLDDPEERRRLDALAARARRECTP